MTYLHKTTSYKFTDVSYLRSTDSHAATISASSPRTILRGAFLQLLDNKAV